MTDVSNINIDRNYISQQQQNDLNSLQGVDSKPQENSPSLLPPKDNVEASERKVKVLSVLSKNHSNVQTLSSEFRSEFSHNESIQNKIDLFQNKFSENIKTIKKQSWNELKAERGLEMMKPVGNENVSMAEFRDAANSLVDEITEEIGRELELPQIKWTACGTVGFDSDVDTAIQPPENGISSEDTCLYKTIRDVVHTSIFDGLSGVQLDTESYIPHPSELDTAKSLSGNQDSRQKYLTHEMANIALQRYESLAQHPDKYQASKSSDINSISDPQQKEAMKIIHEQVEVFMEYLDEEVATKILEQNNIPTEELSAEEISETASEIVKKNPEAYKNAREITIVPLRTALAKKCGVIEGKIKAKEKEMIGNNVSKVNCLELDNLHLERNKVYTLLALLQDQGTHSQAEGKVTLFREEGQIHAGMQKKAKKTIPKQLEQEVQLHRKLYEKGPNPIAEQLFLNNLREEVKPKGFEKPDIESLLLASYEESIQYEHVVDDGLRKISNEGKEGNIESLGRVAVSSGKYCLRTCRNNIRALNEIKRNSQKHGTPLPKNFKEMMGRARRLEFQATQLEQCKRKTVLNKVAAEEMLVQSIVNNRKENGQNIDEVKLRSDVGKMLDLFEYGGKYDNTPLKLSEKMEIMMEKLERGGYLEIEETVDGNGVTKRLPKNLEVRRILQARAGYNRTKEYRSDLIQVHEQAESMTVFKLNLRSPHLVAEFAGKVVKLGQDIRNYAISANILTCPSVDEAKSMDFMNIAMESLESNQ